MLDLGSLNYPAIVVAAVIYFVFGAIWYGAIVKKPFLKYRGEILPEEQGKPVDYLLTFVCDLASAFVLAVVLRLAGAASVDQGVLTGLAMAAGFALSSTFVFGVFHGVRNELWVIESGYVLIAFAVMGALLTLWR